MVKRKCGTCRYFDDRQIAGSGWCQHPNRRELQHMVLVRKTELACRNGWDQDLWEQSSGDAAHAMSEPDRVPMPSPTPGVVPPVSASHDSGRDLYTDKITSIGIRRPEPPAVHIDADLPAAYASAEEIDSNLSPEQSRSAVREARRRREEARKAEQRKQQEAVVKHVGDLLDSSDGSSAHAVATSPETSAPAAPPTHEQRPVSERRVVERVPRSVDPPQPWSPERRSARVMSEPAIEYPSRPPRFQSSPSKFPATQPPAVSRPPAAASPAREDAGGRTEPLPTADVRRALKEDVGQQRIEQPVRSSATEGKGPVRDFPEMGVRAPVPSRPIPTMPKVGSRPREHWEGAAVPKPAAPLRLYDDLPRALDTDPIDVAEHLATVSRCCETCRDFKRVGDGGQGWCSNPHAFTERRMVQGADLACRSSIGVWWLPHDDLWLEQADTTHHGRPTPMLDELLNGTPVGRKGMGQRSSRRGMSADAEPF
jgi:hypothetical protein